jgi:hypothetical protein
VENESKLYNRLWFQIGALSLLFIILHIPTIQLDFLRDDIFILNKCETTPWKAILVDGFRFSRVDFGNPWWVEVKDIAHFFRPLLIASFKVTISIFGNNPLVHHLINVLIHILTAILILFTGRRFFKSPTAPFLAAAFFLFSMHNQWTVMWIVARKELLVGLFMLVAFNFHISGNMLKAAFFMILAMMCGEHAVAFPFIIVAFELLTNGSRVQSPESCLPDDMAETERNDLPDDMTELLDNKTETIQKRPLAHQISLIVKARWKVWAMYFSILGAYIVIRHLLLGGLPLPPSPYFTHPLSKGAWSFYALKEVLFATALTISMLFVDRPVMTLWINHPSIMFLCIVLTIGVLWWAYKVSKNKLLFITFALLSLVSFLPFTPMVAMPIYLYTPMIFWSLAVGAAQDGPCSKKREDRTKPERYFLIAVVVTIILHTIGTGIWTYSRFNEKFSYPVKAAPKVAELVRIAESESVRIEPANLNGASEYNGTGKRPIVLVDLPYTALTLPFLLQKATGRTGEQITAVSMHTSKNTEDGSKIRQVTNRSWIIENRDTPYFSTPGTRALSFLPKGLIKKDLIVERKWFAVAISELGPTPPLEAKGHRFFTTEPSVISVKFTIKENVPDPIIISFINEEPKLFNAPD